MKVITWNVNGIRARERDVLQLFDAEAPDVVCLQEIKASPEAVPESLKLLPGYWSLWHGNKGYSGVSIHLAHRFFPAPPVFEHPAFDVDTRIVTARAGELLLASIYVPNGNRDYEEKVRFIDALDAWVEARLSERLTVLLCGDFNVARLEIDVHPKLRNLEQIGQTPEERGRFERLLGHGLVDLARRFTPEDDRLFTWWAPWRNLRERNIGWRLDYHLASLQLAERARSIESRRGYGSSDHGPVVALYELPPLVSSGEGAPPPAIPPPGKAQLGFDF